MARFTSLVLLTLMLPTSIAFMPPLASALSASASAASSAASRGLYATIGEGKTGEASGKVKEALKKMRGVSISVGYEYEYKYKDDTESESESESLTQMEMEILSQELRKAKTASIFTSDLNAIKEFTKEQESAKGNFPGPCPVIYDGSVSNVKEAIEMGASAVVLDFSNEDDVDTDVDTDVDVDTDIDVDVICRVENVHHVKKAVEAGYEYAFLLSNTHTDNDTDNDAVIEMLSEIPNGAVIIISLDAMQKNSNEIVRGKELIGLSSSSSSSNNNINNNNNSNSNKIHGLVIKKACVGDEEDIKYTSFVVGGLTKKASSTFAMTGLTGSTNGHFGTMSDNASIDNAKWSRNQ